MLHSAPSAYRGIPPFHDGRGIGRRPKWPNGKSKAAEQFGTIHPAPKWLPSPIGLSNVAAKWEGDTPNEWAAGKSAWRTRLKFAVSFPFNNSLISERKKLI